ncbi:MAG: nickel-dependent hydrogenase large subunit [Anaerolineaceae bacterium]|nr:nickel-dependent hydrogenase large subunit [Anaerolineaceae bacterium]
METIPKVEKFIVPIGPQHPALKEPGHFEFAVDGETVISASARLGYVHRGIEKGCEARNYIQALYLLERVCGICSHIHATAFSLGVERLAGVTVSPRAMAIRELVAELERLHSHMLWLGVAAHEAGFDSLFMYSWRDRETIMDILENFSGNRVNYSVNVIGGVKVDVSPKLRDEMLKGMDQFEKRIIHYRMVVVTDETLSARTRNVGGMTHDEAEKLGAIGPTARASGVDRDLRRDAPYLAYREFPTRLIMSKQGDLHARFTVRIDEMLDSIRVIRKILKKLPDGELQTRVPRRIAPGETVSRVEAPRGELIYFIKSNGTDMPERVKTRPPTLCNWGSVLTTVIGHKLADVPMILSGIDPCFSCNDRMVSVIRNDRPADLWSWEALRQYGIRYYQK